MGQIKNIKLHIVTDIKSLTNNNTNFVTMVAFGDLSTPAGLKALNEHLATRSYIEGYVPCQADVTILSSMSSSPASEYCHVARWYRHIKSFSGEEQKSFPGVPESASSPAKAPAKDDDDFDIFGDDDEEEEETEEEKRIKEERLAAYHAKKATKQAVIAKSSLLLDVKPWDDETDMAKMEELV